MFRQYADAGFGPELLPILPHDAAISPASKHPETLLRSRGKIPGKLGRDGWFGFKDWTDHRACDEDHRKWDIWRAKCGAGISMQGREFPAVDIDVDDAGLATELRDLASQVLGAAPVRTRGTSRCLMVYACEGLGRRRVAFLPPEPNVDAKPMAVELLAHGQQYVVEGIHPSGQPYVWDGSASPAFLGADALTRVSAEDFDLFFDKVRELVESRGWVVVSASQGGSGNRSGVPQESLLAPSFDAACAALKAIPNDLDYDGWHRVLVAFYAATGGTSEAQAAFEEWSASSAADLPDVTDEKWVDLAGRTLSIGWHELSRDAARHSGDAAFGAKFEFLPVPVEPGETLKLPAFDRKPSGQIESNASNLRLALERPDLTGLSIGFDEFKGDAMVGAEGKWRPLQDEDYFTFRLRLERIGFKGLTKDLLRDAVWWVAHRNKFDSAHDWLGGLTWDGTPRIERFFIHCFGVADTPYARACGAYVWTAHAGRVLDPGCIAAMVPVLIGPQGHGKSRAVAAISPSKDFHDELSLSDDNVELARKMRGTLVGELPELTGLKTRALEAIKAWITQTHDRWRPVYKEMNVRYARRLVLWGTSNEDQIFADPTGERRWLPLEVGRIDVSRIEAERNQLWAEGAQRWRREGVAFDQAEKLAKAEHAQFRVVDAWEERLARWLDEAGEDQVTRRASGEVTLADAMRSGLRIEEQHQHKAAQMRAADVLRALGMVRTRKRVDGVPTYVWMASEALAPA